MSQKPKKKKESIFIRIFKFFCSIKLAVFVIVALAILSAVGTIYEAKYDANYAQKLVYHSPYMYFVLGLMCIQLICVMIDRWPWKKRHTGFILAHIGIILTLAGSIVTRYWGVDGSIPFGIGQSQRRVTINEHEINVFSSFDGKQFSRMATRQADFLIHSPKKNPMHIQMGPDKLSVFDYHHYTKRIEQIKPLENSKPTSGPAVRVQLQNANVNMTQWMILEGQKSFEMANLGPARIIISKPGGFEHSGNNEFVLYPEKDGKSLKYSVYNRRLGKVTGIGKVKEGGVIETGWMGLKIRLLRYLPIAHKEVTYEPTKYPSGRSVSAIKMKFNDEEHWMGMNSIMKFYSKDKVYIVSYGNRRIDLGFEVKLVDFRVGRYKGTMRAMSYESDVVVKGLGKVNISMNNPMKHNGFTFYQASFEEDEAGRPTTSILSVNRDPGRPWKYLGSFLVILGAGMLFYMKKYGRNRRSKTA